MNAEERTQTLELKGWLWGECGSDVELKLLIWNFDWNFSEVLMKFFKIFWWNFYKFLWHHLRTLPFPATYDSTPSSKLNPISSLPSINNTWRPQKLKQQKRILMENNLRLIRMLSELGWRQWKRKNKKQNAILSGDNCKRCTESAAREVKNYEVFLICTFEEVFPAGKVI